MLLATGTEDIVQSSAIALSARASNRSKLDVFELRLRVGEVKVPTRYNDPDSVCWITLGQKLDIPPEVLRCKNGPHRERVESWASNRSLTEPAPRPTKPILPFDEFVPMAIARRSRDLASTGEKVRKQGCSELANALNRILDAGHGDRDARECLSQMLEQSADTDVKFRTEITRCLAYLDKWESNEDLPDDPTHLIRYGMARANLTAQMVEARTGIKKKSVKNWKLGRGKPRSTRFDDVASLESCLNFPPKTLARALKQHWCLRPPAERCVSDWGKSTSSRKDDRYILHDWPKTVDSEFTLWSQFRTQAKLPPGMRRSGKRWRPDTIDIARQNFSTLFGTWCSPESNPDFKIDPKDLTLAYLVFPKMFETRLNDAMRRMGLNHAEGREFLSRWELDIITFLRAWVHPVHGWLTQMPQLADRLRPLYAPDGSAFISEEDIARVRSDWIGACANARASYLEIRQSHKDFVEHSRDAHADVLPILEMPNPFVAFDMLCEGLKLELPKLEHGTKDYAYATRDILVGAIQTQCALRVKTLQRLDLDHLRWDEAKGVWYLLVPRRLFKNGDKGPYFWPSKNGRPLDHYRRVLQDTHGLYAAIKEYLSWGRSLVLARGCGSMSDALIVVEPRRRVGELRKKSQTVEPGRATVIYLNDLLHNATSRYLGYDEERRTGILGIKHFGPHAFRHILATAVMKTTNAFDKKQAAADAIHDGLSTVEEYVRYCPSARDEAVTSAIADGMKAAAAQRKAA